MLIDSLEIKNQKYDSAKVLLKLAFASTKIKIKLN